MLGTPPDMYANPIEWDMDSNLISKWIWMGYHGYVIMMVAKCPDTK